MELKKKVFSEVSSLCPEHAIIVNNTSTLSNMEDGKIGSKFEKRAS